MAYLEIAYLTGDVERHELSKQQPVSIGSHKSNDICIDEDEVELMHCRVAWNKDAFEAVAAGTEPIDLNGTPVQRATLSSGDVMRFGTADVAFKTGEEVEGEAAAGSESAFGLKPISDEIPSATKRDLFGDDEPAPEKPKPEKKQKKQEQSAPPKKPKKPTPAPPPPQAAAEPDEVEEVDEFEDEDGDDDWDRMDGLAGLAAESQVETPQRRTLPGREEPEEDAADEKEAAPAAEAETGEEAGEAEEPLSERLRHAMRSRQVRPGEEDSLRSPLVLGLGGGAAVLLLVGVTFYFMAGRQTTQAEFDAAKDLYDQGNYNSAIQQFENFVVAHPRGELADQARLLMDQARVDQHIEGGAPQWREGLDALRGFISNHRDEDYFAQHVTGVWERAGRIALGAARDAGRSFNRDLLEISEQASTILNTYIPQEDPPEQLLRQIEEARRSSQAAILRNETFEEALAELDRQLENQQPMQALVTWRDLLVRYPDIAEDSQRGPKLAQRLQNTLEVERQLVSVEELNRPGISEPRERRLPPPTTLVFHARSRTDEVSVGQAVIVLAQDCCYGVDTITGRPVWRRVVGLNLPFFPLREPTLPSVVLFDTNHQELVRLNQNTGELIWRQPIGEPASGQPLLDEGQIYLPTAAGGLYKVDLESGEVTTKLQFSQGITGPVAIAGDEHLVGVGDREVAYTLSKRPLACEAVSYLGQPAGSVEAPLLAMGPYILMPQNTNPQQSTLRLIDTRNPATLEEIASARIAGQVLDEPVIRGRDLFVPSTSERVSAFTVSDDPGQPPLTVGPTFQVKGDQRSPIFLLAGPDRQLWMASSALRKLQLTTDAIEADQRVIALGLASQPMQFVGGNLFNARRLPYAEAVTLTQTDRDELVSEWRTVLGARLIACSTHEESGTIVCATDAGGVFRLAPEDWNSGGLYDEAATLLPLPAELEEPLLAASLPDGQVAIAAGDPEPRIWVMTRLGQIDRRYNLQDPLQLPPVQFGDKLLLAVAGELQIARGSGQTPVQDFALASDEAESTTWRQVLPIDDANIAAVTMEGSVIHVRYQTNPRPHLGEVSRIELGAAVDFQGDASAERLALVDAANTVRVFNSSTLDPLAEREMPATVTNDVWLLGGRVYVETGRELHALDADDELQDAWPNAVTLESSLAGRPVQYGSQLIIAEQNGRVSAVDASSGELLAAARSESPITGAPLAFSGELLVPLLDGSLQRVTQALADASPSAPRETAEASTQ